MGTRMITAAPGGRSAAPARLRQPRIAALEPAQWSEEIRSALEPFLAGEAAGSLLKTLAHHPAAVRGIMPVARYLERESTLPAPDRALLALRAARLCWSDAIWADQAFLAGRAGLSEIEIGRVARGPRAEGWRTWEAALLTAADELYRDSFISDATWAALAARYSTEELIDAVFTAGEYVMLSMMANSFGVQPDASLRDRIPPDIPHDVAFARASPVKLETPRIPPLPRESWTDEVRALLDPQGTGRPVLNLYTTLARHPRFYRPRAVQSEYIRLRSTLSDRAREILILRIGWLCGAEYEWAQHVPAARRAGMTDDEIRRIALGPQAPGWDSLEATLVRAADELHRHDTIADATWTALAARCDTRQLIDVVITVGGYRIVSQALNTLGVPQEK